MKTASRGARALFAAAAMGCTLGLAAPGARAQNASAMAASGPRQAAPQAADVAGAAQETAHITTEVYFGKGASRLDGEARARLDAWLRAAAGVKAAFVLAIGHTDPGEAASYPKAVKLSEARAGSVRAYLASKGIEAGRVHIEGKGDTQPVATNDTPAERAKNRRVDVGMVGQHD